MLTPDSASTRKMLQNGPGISQFGCNQPESWVFPFWGLYFFYFLFLGTFYFAKNCEKLRLLAVSRHSGAISELPASKLFEISAWVGLRRFSIFPSLGALFCNFGVIVGAFYSNFSPLAQRRPSASRAARVPKVQLFRKCIGRTSMCRTWAILFTLHCCVPDLAN